MKRSPFNPIVDNYYLLKYRFRHSPWSPLNWYWEIKFFIQRGKRGWSTRDTWNLDSYLSKMLIGSLKYLKVHKHGIPCEMFDTDLPHDLDGIPTDESHKIAEKKWDEVMDKIIAGFEAAERINDGLYESELGNYLEDFGPGQYDEIHRLEIRDEKIRVEGMNLFVKYFQNLWD